MIHERDRRTDRQTPHDSKDRACIASRGNKSKVIPQHEDSSRLLGPSASATSSGVGSMPLFESSGAPFIGGDKEKHHSKVTH